MVHGIERARRALLLAALAAAAAALVVAGGCGGNDSGPAAPTGLAVDASREHVEPGGTASLAATPTYRDAATVQVDWYVEGIPGGDEAVGTITSGNPVVYTAPDTIPQGGHVTIEARLASDPSVTGSTTLAIVLTVLHVDPATGDDLTATGAAASPFATITAALAAAEPADTVLVSAGVYAPDRGEAPPYVVPPHVTLRGTSRDECVLYGPGNGYVVVLSDSATVERFTVRDWNDDTIGVYSTGHGRIGEILINDRFNFSGIRAFGVECEVVIEGCELVNTDQPQQGRGFELVMDTLCTVRGCVVNGWNQAVFTNRDSEPLIEGCDLTGNQYGVDTWAEEGYYTAPDLGGGLRGSAGDNLLQMNAVAGLASRTAAAIYAIGDTWNQYPPVVSTESATGVDILNLGGGLVYWCECR
jgi:hypothetical protein